MLALKHLGNDLIERNNFDFDSGGKELEGEVGGGQLAGYGDLPFFDLGLRERTGRNDHRTVTFANASTARHERVLVLNVRICVKRDGSDVVDALLRFLIQGLYVAERVCEAQSRDADLVCGQPVKHESVVGVGAMRDRDFANVSGSR